MSWWLWRKETPNGSSVTVVRPQGGCCCGCLALMPPVLLVTALIITFAILR